MTENTASERDSADRPPRPIIEGLTPYDEIDLDELGGEALNVFITYDGIAVGQLIVFNWTGADKLGNAVGFSGDVDIADHNFDPRTKRATVSLSNAFVVAAADGYAFASFQPTFPALEESMRAFCFVGVRPHRLEHMPVAQAPKSHNLFIDPDSLGSAGATFLVPAYQAMQVADKVTLTFVGYESDGTQDDTWSKLIDVQAQHVGQVLSWNVPSSYFDFIKKGYAEVYYEIQFAAPPKRLKSPTQTFQVDKVPDTPPLLPALDIDNYESGLLDPELFPDGLTLRVPPNAELMVSDWLLLHFNDEWGEQQLRVDLSSLESGVIVFNLAKDKLKGLGRIRLGYQVAREGVAYSAAVREVELVVRREDAPLKVFFAESEGGEGEFNARLPAGNATAGAYIDLSGVTLREGETLEVYWQGRSELGNKTFVFPFGTVPAEPLNIPPAAVAANMEQGETSVKRFPVYYRIAPVGHESKKLNLRILPLARDKYPTVQCSPRRDTDLYVEDIKGTHADLTLPNWPFMSPGQHLVITLLGVAGGSPRPYPIRNSPVTQEEVDKGVINAILLKETLENLDDNSPLEFNVSVDFEGQGGSDNWTLFTPTSMTLRK
jgi:hypothetical protein